ncbi:hypothetical protein RAS12_29840 [Achromobacter seleniivolatilans]|uniref:Uncharacterized protein n=1 Tax=Achromobacter seleniivolatilans TaxID=3047478 RepID=A0ABY9M224_9BURK|nr:hypothetical protein [Achromobacter sp. R39]WMD20742.1 hypothetical protein RAS12_29840 [Achromobacter sp. R39]
MSAHTCSSSSPPFQPAWQASQKTSSLPTSASSPAAVQEVQPQPTAPAGIIAKIWRAYKKRRAEACLRNLATELDAHMLKDVGAPTWLVNESHVNRDLGNLRKADYMRW